MNYSEHNKSFKQEKGPVSQSRISGNSGLVPVEMVELWGHSQAGLTNGRPHGPHEEPAGLLQKVPHFIGLRYWDNYCEIIDMTSFFTKINVINTKMQLRQFVISVEFSELDMELWSSAKVQKGWWLLLS